MSLGKEILEKYKKVTVIGISPKDNRPSHKVASYLIDNGFEVNGVRPGCTEILGRAVYAKLADVPAPLEVVDVFRASEFVPAIVDEAIRLGAKAIWLQEGVTHPEAEEKARQAGLDIVSDICIKKVHDGSVD